MDPLSVTASIIAILQVSASTTRAFRDLRSLCKSLPGRLHALSNEVSDIELVLQEVASIAKERGADPAFGDHNSSLRHVLEQAYHKLNQIKTIVLKLAEFCKESRISLVNAHAWKKNQPRLQSLQEELQSVKQSLNIILGTLHTQDVMRIRVDLQRIYTSTSDTINQSANTENRILQRLDDSHDNVNDAICAIYQRVDQRVGDIEKLLQNSHLRLQEREAQQMASTYDMSPNAAVRRRRTQHPPSRTREKSDIKKYGHQDVGVRVNKSHPCRLDCSCRCHAQSGAVVPSFADRIVGQLFIGYTGLPTLSKKCNVKTCEKSKSSQISVEYWFPLSFIWSQIFRFRLAYQPNIGPQFELTTLRRVPDSAPCVHFALRGDIEGLKDLFGRGLASPRDVSSTRGYSILRWAVYGHQYQTAKFLMQAGADPDYRPIAAHDNSPRHKANQFLLMGGLSDEDVDPLHTLTEGSDFVEEQNYTSLHKIVLGLLGRNLEQELQVHPELLDVPDAMGRTPLTWAACCGDSHSIVTLLQHGAEVNTLDIQHTNALSYAAERNFVVCVRLLLEAGADPNIAERNNLPAADAINVAVRNASDPLIIKNLLDFGANPDSCGVDHMTGLIHAARRDNLSFALLLLEHNANINALSSANQTPLTTAVTYNSYNVLKLLLDRWFEYSVCPRLKGPHLLKIVADYADVETMRILASTDHLLIKYDKEFMFGDFSTSLENRLDADEALVHAFEELLRVVRYGSESSRISSHCFHAQSPRMMESGLLSTEEEEAEELIHEAVGNANTSIDGDDDFYDAVEDLFLSDEHGSGVSK